MRASVAKRRAHIPAISQVLEKGKIMLKKFGAIVAFALAGLLSAAPAFAVDPATAVEAVGTLTTSSAGFGPIMFGLALAVVGIMVGVKWIKRAKGAA